VRAQPDRGHERNTLADPGHRQTDQAPGESSLEIGEIVELISTSPSRPTCWRSTPPSAASAGEAAGLHGGRRGSAAARRALGRGTAIEAIVKTIQADTQTRSPPWKKHGGRGEGTKLSDAAGQALDEIRNPREPPS
jgi:hypothetical protein